MAGARRYRLRRISEHAGICGRPHSLRRALFARVRLCLELPALLHHPDRVRARSGGALPTAEVKASETRFRAISEAYATLSVPTKRSLYDRLNHGAGWAGDAARGAGGRRHWSRPHGSAGAGGGQAHGGFGPGHSWSASGAGYSPYDEPLHGRRQPRFDSEEWERMHYGPTEAQRYSAFAREFRDAQARGWSGPWEDPRQSRQANFEARRRAEARATAFMNAWDTASAGDGAASRGGPEGEAYRRYVAKYKADQAHAAAAWPKRLLLVGALGVVGLGFAVQSLRRHPYNSS